MGDTSKPARRGIDVGRDGGRLVDVALGPRSDFRGLAANAESRERSRRQETVLVCLE
jgi:hypothetical protein